MPSVGAVTTLSPREVLREVADYYVLGGWSIKHKAHDFTVLSCKHDAATGCLYLILFLPLGLAYLLTDWGDGEIIVQAWENDEGHTDVKIEWRNASRGDVKKIVRWLEEQGEE
jgi:hypothetical protein